MTSFPAPADGRDFDWGPQRTSILAILALVFALPCFIPGVGFIASLLAVFALVGIASSKGRVGGTGLAIAALVLGLISTAFWGAIGYGAWQISNQFSSFATAPAANLLAAVEKGDNAAARAGVVDYTAALLTDEQLASVKTQLNDKLGAYQSAPKGLIELFSSYGEIAHLMKQPPPNSEPGPPPATSRRRWAWRSWETSRRAPSRSMCTTSCMCAASCSMMAPRSSPLPWQTRFHSDVMFGTRQRRSSKPPRASRRQT
jgi:hypothetical protein